MKKRSTPPADTQLARNLDVLLPMLGLSAKGLSLQAGLSESWVKDIIAGRSKNARSDTLQKVANVLGLPVSALTDLDWPNLAKFMTTGKAIAGGFYKLDPEAIKAAVARLDAAGDPTVLSLPPGWKLAAKEPIGLQEPDDDNFIDRSRSNVRPAPGVDPPDAQHMAYNLPRVPIYGTAEGGNDGAFEMNTGEPIDFAKRPPGLEHDKTCYALYVEGESMVPAFFPGVLVFVSTNRKPFVGRFAIVEMKPKTEFDPPKAFLKRIVAVNSETVKLEQYNPAKVFTLKRAEIKNLHLVLNMNELIGTG